MIERFGKILIDDGESLGTMTEAEMIEYLLSEVNDLREDAEERSDYEELRDEIDDLEAANADLEQELEELEEELEALKNA